MTQDSSNKKNFKEFGLSSLAVNNRRTVFLLAILIAFSGLLAYVAMPSENFPEIKIPTIYVGTAYPGNSPKVIEDQITRALEQEISTIEGLDKLSSTSVQGYSTVIAEFDFDVKSEDALIKVKDAVDRAKSDKDFPNDLPADPNVFELNFSDFPIMNINLSGDFSIDQLKEFGEYLQEEIEKLPQINEVNIRGVQDKELEIAIDPMKAQAVKVSLGDIENAIVSENITMSGGELLVDNYRRTIRVEGEFKSPAEIEDIIVKQEGGDLVYLKDVAVVRFGDEEAESFAREFKNPVVMLDVTKRSGKNLLEASEAIGEILEIAKKEYLPASLNITITNDQSDATREQVSNLENSIIFGVMLVVLVLLFFLGLRNAIFVGVAIPLSMMMSFLILNAFGVTLNTMVLFSLVLALGMLVDNGIVVVENIYRLMDEGMGRIEAAKKGIGEVAVPIIASTATTLAAFFPLAIWPGLIGEFMKFLPLTLIVVLGSSLFVALVINPVLTATYMRVETDKLDKKKATKVGLLLTAIGAGFDLLFLYVLNINTLWFGNLFLLIGLLILVNAHFLNPGSIKFQKNFLPKLEKGYRKFLDFALEGKRPRKFLFGSFGLLLLSFVLLGVFTPKVLFFPINEPHYVNVFVSMPIGTDIQKTNEVTKEVETRVLEYIKKYEEEVPSELEGINKKQNWLVKSVIAQVGQGASDPNEGPSMNTTPHKGRVTVSFVEFPYRRGIETSNVMEEIREVVQGFDADVQISVDKDPAGPPLDPPIYIEVEGKEYNEILATAYRIKNHIYNSGVKGFDEIKLDVDLGKPELPIEIDREKARAFNLSTYTIASQIRTALFGKEISTFKQGEDDYPINLRYLAEDRYNLENLLNQKITFRDQTTGKINQVPISAVIKEPKRTSTYSSIKRKEQKRVVSLFSTVQDGYNPNEVVASIQAAMENFSDIKPGYSFKFAGQQEEQAKEMAFLLRALIIAVFLIFMIMVAQFNSTLTPAVIITAVVLSLIGVLLGLVAFQMDFVIIMTMIGIISLAGVVVNNAIVLIDYTNLIMDRKRKEMGLKEDEKLPMSVVIESISEGGQTRLRPVLLTAITTVLGLIPLAIGLNIDFVGLFTHFDPAVYMGGDNVIFFGPMSWAIIFGLSFATFLTLVIVPVMYLILNKVKYRYNID
ncbi:efflux RND transporter permease subunit [Luteibaculum oceani]|uniref:Efflux RND transporter permease subunit n=1 Tax=Luteibaculum oceani TaxID=1294296 RepID=A0A5C6VIG6_9FLAO|nr:efflux RND transporter permease subunit [Luteibaculum oceani]TXC85163.1 efflux RND transporter permease subunit [Luteibaculum oceani]